MIAGSLATVTRAEPDPPPGAGRDRWEGSREREALFRRAPAAATRPNALCRRSGPVTTNPQDISKSTDAALPAQRSPKAAETSELQIHPTTIHLPISVRKGLTAYKKSKRLTNRGACVTAVSACQPRLKELARKERDGGDAGIDAGLFESAPSRPRASEDDMATFIHVRFIGKDVETMDALWQEHGFASRSHMIAVCLREEINSLPKGDTT